MIIIKKIFDKNSKTYFPVLGQLTVAGIVIGCLSYTPLALSKQEAANEASSESVTEPATVKKKRTRRAQTMSTKIYNKLDKVREYVDEKNYKDAESLLISLGKTKRNSYEKAMTWNMEAYLHYNKEDYKKAAESYEKVIAQDNIPESLEQTTLYLSLIHISEPTRPY